MISTYEWKRNKLIPLAEKFANKNIHDKRNLRKDERQSARWNRLFFAEMNRLARAEGI